MGKKFCFFNFKFTEAKYSPQLFLAQLDFVQYYLGQILVTIEKLLKIVKNFGNCQATPK